MLGRVAGQLVPVHPEEVRGIDHGREHVALLGHAHDVLPGMSQVHVALPRHHPEDVQREQRPLRVHLGIGLVQEVGDHVRARPLGMLALEGEARVLLVALGGEAHVVELHLVGARRRRLPRQRDVVLLHLAVRGVGPHQLAVLPPGLPRAPRAHRQLGMVLHQLLVAEDGDARDAVHPQRVHEAHELRQVGDHRPVSRRQRLMEGDVDHAVRIFHVEDHGVAPRRPPLPDDAQAVLAARHQAGQVDGPHLEVLLHRDDLLHDGLVFDPRHQDRSRLEEGALHPVGLLDGGLELARGHVVALRQVEPHQRGQRVALPRAVDLDVRSRGLQEIGGKRRRQRGRPSRGSRRRCGHGCRCRRAGEGRRENAGALARGRSRRRRHLQQDHGA